MGRAARRLRVSRDRAASEHSLLAPIGYLRIRFEPCGGLRHDRAVQSTASGRLYARRPLGGRYLDGVGARRRPAMRGGARGGMPCLWPAHPGYGVRLALPRLRLQRQAMRMRKRPDTRGGEHMEVHRSDPCRPRLRPSRASGYPLPAGRRGMRLRFVRSRGRDRRGVSGHLDAFGSGPALPDSGVPAEPTFARSAVRARGSLRIRG